MPQLRREIGFVFQDFRLLENKNVLENVALASQVIGKPRHYILSAVPEALDLVGLDARTLHDAVNRGAKGVPPVGGRLLGPARRRVRGPVSRRCECHGRSGEIEDSDSTRLRAEVDAHDVGAAGE